MSGPIRTLVVDDEAIICEIISDILACEGGAVESVSAGTCEEALRLAQTNEFDVVFLDVCMDDGSGVELLREIKQVRPGTRVYMITGFQVEDKLEEALAQGAAGAIHKPFRINEILAALYGVTPAEGPLSD